jgi:hypothetical protein
MDYRGSLPNKNLLKMGNSGVIHSEIPMTLIFVRASALEQQHDLRAGLYTPKCGFLGTS